MNKFVPAFASLAKAAMFAVLLFVTLGISTQTAKAQYLASTKAGFVNRVEGKVLIQRAGVEVSDAGRASLGTQMKEGDLMVSTPGSRVELLLSPGSFLRLNENTKLKAVNTRFSAIRFEILEGSVIAEISAEENTNIRQENPLEIITPHGTVAITRTGVYRFDVEKMYTNVSARKGEFWVGSRELALNKTGQKFGKEKIVQLTGGGMIAPEVGKLDKYSTDDFDDWSFERAETLVAAHRSVLNRSSSFTSLNSGWIFDPFYNCYTFIPYGRRFTSPYGFGFYSSFASCGGCGGWGYYWSPYYGSGPYNSAGTTYGSSVNPSPAPRVRGETDRSTVATGRVDVGRRIEPNAGPAVFSGRVNPGFGDNPFPSRSWGGGGIASSPSVTDRSYGGASSGGRVDAGRSVDTGGSAGGASAGGGGRAGGRTGN